MRFKIKISIIKRLSLFNDSMTSSELEIKFLKIIEKGINPLEIINLCNSNKIDNIEISKFMNNEKIMIQMKFY